MRISNDQLDVVLPMLTKAAKEQPNPELESFIENLVVLAIARNRKTLLTSLTEYIDRDKEERAALIAKAEEGRGVMSTRPKPEKKRAVVAKADESKKMHPLLRDS